MSMRWEYRKPCTICYGGNGSGSGQSKAVGGGAAAQASSTTGSQNNTSLPESLKNFGKKERAYVDAFKKNSQLTESQINYINGQLKKIVDENDFAMRVGHGLVETIMNTHFMNQMEVGTSKGAMAPDLRAQLSADYFGHKYTRASQPSNPDFFEKYGYLAPRDKVEAMNASASWYGDTVIRFKRDAVIHRTTFKTDDTLNSWHGPGSDTGHASWLDNPAISGIEGFSSETYKRVKAAESYIHKPDKWVSSVSYGGYFELQYHGHLTFSDVESVTFGDKVPSNFNSLVSQLKGTGVRVFRVQGGSEVEL